MVRQASYACISKKNLRGLIMPANGRTTAVTADEDGRLRRNGKDAYCVLLPRVRQRDGAVAGAVPRLPRMEHAGGRARRAQAREGRRRRVVVRARRLRPRRGA